MPERRALRFSSLDDVMPEVDRLLLGHETVGKWSLGQICRHLSKAMEMTVEGKPIRGYGLMRWTIGPFARRHIFRTGRMPEGVKLPSKALEPKPGLDDRAEAEALRATIRLFLAEDGPFTVHPVFGPLSVEEWRLLHRIHCAHHLSFARPANTTSPRTS